MEALAHAILFHVALPPKNEDLDGFRLYILHLANTSKDETLRYMLYRSKATSSANAKKYGLRMYGDAPNLCIFKIH